MFRHSFTETTHAADFTQTRLKLKYTVENRKINLLIVENGAKVVHHQLDVYPGGKCFLPEMIQWLNSADPVTEEGR